MTHPRLLIVFALLIVVCVAGCEAKPDGNPEHSAKFVILPGVGLKDCRIGRPVKYPQARYGPGESNHEGFLDFPKYGMQWVVQGDRIEGIIFYFRSPKFDSCEGSTDRGITISSTADDVIKLYGAPEQFFDTVVSRFGDDPGAREQSFQYDRLGIIFTFRDSLLLDVRVQKPVGRP
jgi:hypothetical protein